MKFISMLAVYVLSTLAAGFQWYKCTHSIVTCFVALCKVLCDAWYFSYHGFVLFAQSAWACISSYRDVMKRCLL